jgi:hypothetical protein
LEQLSETLKQKVYQEQITYLFQGVWVSAISSFAIPLLVAYVQRDQV